RSSTGNTATTPPGSSSSSSAASSTGASRRPVGCSAMPWPMRSLGACLALLLSCNICLADPTLTLRQLEFQGWTGAARQGDPTTVYSLVGTGFYYETPATDDAEQVIAAWIAAHPDAAVTVVDREPVTTVDVRAYHVYLWLQDGDANLNLSLVR